MAAGKVHVVINPVSGRSRGGGALAGLCRAMASAGYAVEVDCTAGPGDARRLGRAAAMARAKAVVVAGGDGTVSEVVAGLCETGGAGAAGVGHVVPVLIAPRGTENVLAKYLGLKLDAQRLLGVLQAGHAREIDVGLADGKPFLLVAGVGFDAEVVRRVHAARGGHLDYGAYFWPLWRTFWGYRHPRLSVAVDGAPIFEGTGLVIAGHIGRYAMGLRILRDARPDDGLLDVCVLECRARRDLLRHAAGVAMGRHIGRRGVHYRSGRTVCVTATGPAAVELDGDPGGEIGGGRSLTLTVSPRPARFLVPGRGMGV
jgi:diacylglycerol kinase (ATP)